jgi:hypothetical protein
MPRFWVYSYTRGCIARNPVRPGSTIGRERGGVIVAAVAPCSCHWPAHPVCRENLSWGVESGMVINWVHGLRGCGELQAVVLVPPWCLCASRAGVCATQNTNKDPSAGFAITSASHRSFQIGGFVLWCAGSVLLWWGCTAGRAAPSWSAGDWAGCTVTVGLGSNGPDSGAATQLR